ncbi:class GN sortase [Paraglaciecola marina]|uniref:class GN sortase n=1 Tax=Paraglaciecola marina TaxID=2500157 RepID=UPI001EF101A3|nr:class GN sortase [Paraglaciecola marina]
MYALTYKKKSLGRRLTTFIYKYKWITLVLLLGAYQFSSGIYIFAKAELAQRLIARAWHKSLDFNEPVKPWPWADTYPIAELRIKNKNWFILAGASGRNLAFAPSHISATPKPGEQGNSVIVGHRDTQFNRLKNLQTGDIISVNTGDNTHNFKITQLRIAHESQLEYMENHESINGINLDEPSLTLITCYPFDSVLPNPTHRYIVRAVAI